MASEFDLIARHFRRPAPTALMGVGDDAALLRVTPGTALAASVDTLVTGVHFLPDVAPEALGWKALAVNLSDMAAMGAQPRWALLSLAMPEADEGWVSAFARGFHDCAAAFGVELVGGDTTRGPLTISVTILGEVAPGQALLRSGAQAGDDIWVSGFPGRAALGLAHLQGRTALSAEAAQVCRDALERPVPRIGLGVALRGVASAAIDVSDGLLADLSHILDESRVGAHVRENLLPRAAELTACVDAVLARRCLLAGGDDYELAFAAAPDQRQAMASIARALVVPLTRIGHLVAATHPAVTLLDADGQPAADLPAGFDHFA